MRLFYLFAQPDDELADLQAITFFKAKASSTLSPQKLAKVIDFINFILIFIFVLLYLFVYLFQLLICVYFNFIFLKNILEFIFSSLCWF